MDKEKSNLRSISWIDSLPPYRLLHLAAANLDLDHVIEILSNNKVDINNVEGFGQGKRSGQKPGHLYQHFYYSQRTTAICQLFENIDTWDTEDILTAQNLIQVFQILENVLVIIKTSFAAICKSWSVI